jgi:hypothetical protein
MVTGTLDGSHNTHNGRVVDVKAPGNTSQTFTVDVPSTDNLATIWVTATDITAVDAFKATAGCQPGLSFDCRAYQAGWRRRTIVSVMSQALRMLTIANSKRAPASAFNPKSFSR